MSPEFLTKIDRNLEERISFAGWLDKELIGFVVCVVKIL